MKLGRKFQKASSDLVLASIMPGIPRIKRVHQSGVMSRY